PLYCGHAGITVQIAHLENRKGSKCFRHQWMSDVMVTDSDIRGILHSARIEARRFERKFYQRVNRIPVLDVEKIDSAAENLTFMFLLDAQSLPSIAAAEAYFQPITNIWRRFWAYLVQHRSLLMRIESERFDSSRREPLRHC